MIIKIDNKRIYYVGFVDSNFIHILVVDNAEGVEFALAEYVDRLSEIAIYQTYVKEFTQQSFYDQFHRDITKLY